MSLCKLAPEMFIHGVTPVSNLFIAEYLPSAPADYVKVYIYALMDCYHQQEGDMDSFAKDLNLDIEVVRNAFSFWERRGLISCQSGVYAFMPVLSAVSFQQGTGAGALNQYQDFNNALTLIMDNRLLLPDDFQMAYDWMEILGMSEDCVLTMVSYAIHHKYKKGNKVSFSTLNKLAVSWAEKGILTAKQAEDYVEHEQLVHSGADTLLKHLGIYGRNPTVDEYRLYMKWTEEYGFSLNAILKACKEMVYSKNPSFALLDVILDKYREKDILDAPAMEKDRQEEKQKHQLYKEVVSRCGGYGNVTPAQKAMIDSLLALGFNRQGLLYLCDHCAAVGYTGLKQVEELAKALAKDQITEENQVGETLHQREQEEKQVKAFLTEAGFTRRPTPADREMYRTYLAVFDHQPEILTKAARLAAKASNKTQALSEILNEWKRQGVQSVDQAQAPEIKGGNPALQYAQRETGYDQQQLFDNM